MRHLKSITPQLNQDFTQSILYNLVRDKKNIYLQPKEKHTSTLIWLHGLGDNAENYLALFNNPEVTPLTPETKVVMLTAPEKDYNGEVQTTWYERHGQKYDAEESKQYLVQILQDEIKQLGGPQNVYIGGFSQGCVMSLLVGLSVEYTLGGIIGCSGFMFDFAKSNQQSSKTPIMIYHGAQDDRIPWQLAESSYVELKTNHKGPLTIEVVQGFQHALSFRAFEMMKQFFKVT